MIDAPFGNVPKVGEEQTARKSASDDEKTHFLVTSVINVELLTKSQWVVLHRGRDHKSTTERNGAHVRSIPDQVRWLTN